MTSTGARVALHCPIGLFEQQEAKIEVLTKAINAAPTASEKAAHARTLIDGVQVLLRCGSYNQADGNCSLCRNFSELRLKTANLIIAMSGLNRSP